jgi:hypothetical protein
MHTATHPDLPPGMVVRWHTARSVGLGQIDRHNADGSVTIRPWLPTKSKEITTTPDRVTPLRDLTALLVSAMDTVRLLEAGL